jgi:hypothetical protein
VHGRPGPGCRGLVCAPSRNSGNRVTGAEMSVINLRNAGIGTVLSIALACAAIGQAADRQARPHGIYSSMQAVDGEYSGFEFIVLPSDAGDFVVVQVAEGSPQKPVLLPATLGGSRPADSNAIQFDHPEWGPFRGVTLGDSLVGEFTRARHTITLRRGPSIWQ